MMTLDEVIEHAEEVAEEYDKLCKANDSFNFSQPRWKECANEHRQLAEWLKELKQLREYGPCEDAIIQEEATNGDMIKAIFNIPDGEIDEGLSTAYIYTSKRVLKDGSQVLLRKQLNFSRDWWNAPYKEGVNG